MLYTIKALKEKIDSSSVSYWGDDTQGISSIVSSIIGAKCSPCAKRRYMGELKFLLEKHGDTIAETTNKTGEWVVPGQAPVVKKGSREQCIECTRKHLSQAYVLQGEFYSGYTDYLGLIEAHLTEALEECPKDNPYLMRQINRCISTLNALGRPEIPLNLCMLLSEMSKNTGNESKIPVKPEKLEKIALKTLISGVPDVILLKIRDILDKIGTFTDKTLKHAEISGRLACSAEMFAPFSPRLTELLRSRRLSFTDDTPEKDLYGDILDAINDKLGGVPSEKWKKNRLISSCLSVRTTPGATTKSSE